MKRLFLSKPFLKKGLSLLTGSNIRAIFRNDEIQRDENCFFLPLVINSNASSKSNLQFPFLTQPLMLLKDWIPWIRYSNVLRTNFRHFYCRKMCAVCFFGRRFLHQKNSLIFFLTLVRLKNNSLFWVNFLRDWFSIHSFIFDSLLFHDLHDLASSDFKKNLKLSTVLGNASYKWIKKAFSEILRFRSRLVLSPLKANACVCEWCVHWSF